MRRWLARLLFACALGIALAAPAWAAEEWAYDLSSKLMSPFCPGRALTECPSPQAAELRAWIHAQERAGLSRAEVEAELIGIYGESLLQAPRAQGVGAIAYLVPLAIFLAGGGLVLLFLRRQRGMATPTPASRPIGSVDPELERSLEEEFARSRSDA